MSLFADYRTLIFYITVQMWMKRKYAALIISASILLVVAAIVLGSIRPGPSFNGQQASLALILIAIILTLALAVLTISHLSERQVAIALKEERKRIAADLHDEIGPGLALVKFQLDGLQCPDPGGESRRTKAMESLDELSQKLREITRGLATAIDHPLLVDQVSELVAKLTSATGIPIYFDYRVSSLLNGQQILDCYLVIQETLNNALKHGAATEIFISIYEEHHCLNFTCRDNGEGFDYKTAISQHTGMGLSNIAWRMRRLKGKYFVDSHPGSGSAFHYQISLG
jgi:signal transduction histidine kinase